MKVAAIVAARMDSKRMYGKPMKLICGKPIIKHVVDRLRNIKKIDNIIVATSTKKENDIFINFAKKEGVKYFRGNEE